MIEKNKKNYDDKIKENSKEVEKIKRKYESKLKVQIQDMLRKMTPREGLPQSVKNVNKLSKGMKSKLKSFKKIYNSFLKLS